MPAKPRVPAVDGWFTDDAHLLGHRCASCGSYFFPRALPVCRNPACGGGELRDVKLGRRGVVWSHTTQHYPPPPPFIAPEPFAPFTIAAVELADEKMVVLGQVERGARVEVGTAVELVIVPLYEDDDAVRTTWAWRPVA